MGATKVKTSVSLSREVLEALDQVANDRGQRSALVERAVVEFLARRGRKARDARDVEIINANAEEMNREAEAWLELQSDMFEGEDGR